MYPDYELNALKTQAIKLLTRSLILFAESSPHTPIDFLFHMIAAMLNPSSMPGKSRRPFVSKDFTLLAIP